MVERVPWMKPVDYEILLFLDDHDIQISPKVLSANIDYDRQYVSKRCGVLTDVDLLESDGSGLYQLTDTGRAYLAGNLEVTDLEPDR
ncbi:MarR family transcriptional regulator [Natrarchaeobaculum sulfurireducens]|uniref:Transcriptional regulator, MarR family n=1 Tax=Natrarchaeobaculum sulfurireducens TaxID=2044521 RepID=A0A346PCE2_9EURY|nr:MarR family transcriptional regulator [Natrarchaeobaculum sulfurireducens]AXR77187.1 Transcriptional regulator, MarR family [Natrarchaeobaculum sulfurireducens]